MAYDNSVPYSFIKRGIYYFERRVPRDLKKHYDTSKISYSLRTKSAAVAASRARQAAEQLDQYWYHLRILNSELPGKHRLRIRQGAPASVSPDTNVPDVTLSEAVEVYLRLKGSGRPITFHRAAERSCGYVIDTCGDKHLSEYTRTDANAFRDMLINRGMAGSSITRVFGTVRAVFNFTSSELGLTMPNPFSGVYYDRSLGVKDRQPLSIDEIRVVQKECRKTNDDLRWLVALVSDTGMRLAEAAGLHIEDLKLEDDVPHVEIRDHPWRRLKTAGSTRTVPAPSKTRVNFFNWRVLATKACGAEYCLFQIGMPIKLGKINCFISYG